MSEFNPKQGWLKVRLKEALEDVKTWPKWMLDVYPEIDLDDECFTNFAYFDDEEDEDNEENKT